MAPVIPFIPLIAAGVGAAGTIGAAAMNKQAPPAKLPTPLVEQDNSTNPGGDAKAASLVNTTPQGLLSQGQTSKRNALIGSQ